VTVTRYNRIMGMTILFTVPVAYFVEHWKYAAPAVMAAMITGIFAGEAWHCWRMSAPERKDNG
jgi:ethanolamine transporter EutH